MTPQTQSVALAQAKHLLRQLILRANDLLGMPNAGEYGLAVSDDVVVLFIVDSDGNYVELGQFELVHA